MRFLTGSIAAVLPRLSDGMRGCCTPSFFQCAMNGDTSLRGKTAPLLSFPYVCPEPVLVK
jgi:hypothetical protein